MTAPTATATAPARAAVNGQAGGAAPVAGGAPGGPADAFPLWAALPRGVRAQVARRLAVRDWGAMAGASHAELDLVVEVAGLGRLCAARRWPLPGPTPTPLQVLAAFAAGRRALVNAGPEVPRGCGWVGTAANRVRPVPPLPPCHPEEHLARLHDGRIALAEPGASALWAVDVAAHAERLHTFARPIEALHAGPAGLVVALEGGAHWRSGGAAEGRSTPRFAALPAPAGAPCVVQALPLAGGRTLLLGETQAHLAQGAARRALDTAGLGALQGAAEGEPGHVLLCGEAGLRLFDLAAGTSVDLGAGLRALGGPTWLRGSGWKVLHHRHWVLHRSLFDGRGQATSLDAAFPCTSTMTRVRPGELAWAAGGGLVLWHAGGRRHLAGPAPRDGGLGDCAGFVYRVLPGIVAVAGELGDDARAACDALTFFDIDLDACLGTLALPPGMRVECALPGGFLVSGAGRHHVLDLRPRGPVAAPPAPPRASAPPRESPPPAAR